MITIIPAIDIIGGKCVRLTRGDYNTKKVYHDDPLDAAKMFEDHGMKRLHMVDLDGAKAKKVINAAVVKKVAGFTGLIVDFGGGVQSKQDLQLVLDSGAQMVTAGSIAVRDSQTVMEWVDEFGAQRIILGADFKDGRIAVSGWQESDEATLFEFIQSYYAKGLRQVICTDVQRDGMLGGPALDTYCSLIDQFPEIKLIASGGVGSIDDVYKLNELNLAGVIIGKAIYEQKITMKELEPFLC